MKPFSPAQLAKRWQDEVGVLADKKGLTFEINLDDTLPAELYGDEEAISKVALNLLSNAIKFTEKGSVKLSLKCNRKAWDIIVEDTGIGIPPHARELIFDEFRQVDQSMTREYSGSGLGLAIAQKYVRAMGGRIRVESELNKGSMFTVSLPLKTHA
jgi:signal transduction histidine kinase